MRNENSARPVIEKKGGAFLYCGPDSSGNPARILCHNRDTANHVADFYSNHSLRKLQDHLGNRIHSPLAVS